ncbi:putative short-chain dehydrogenase [Xylariaceae sp. AK1471]|nr:putative short-chain dehydrogenase [Xylariaceae sp. AK1471]
MGFLYSQLFKRIPYPTGSFAGKTVVITGSNGGLGKEAARHFARLGVSRLILAVRRLDAGEDAKREIESTTSIGKNAIQVWQLDMATYASVQDFAARLNAELDRVDIFIANAGIARSAFHVAEDNEEMITVNVVSTILLMLLVLPKMEATAARFNVRPNFSIVSSIVHEHTQLPQKSAPRGQLLATINDPVTAQKNWEEQYPISKLLQVLYVRAFVEDHPVSEFPVTINLTNPGLCHSELGREVNTWGFWFIKLILARSMEVGSRTLVHAGSQGAESHGQYLSDCEISTPSPFVTSKDGKETQVRVVAELTAKLEAIKPGVTRAYSR